MVIPVRSDFPFGRICDRMEMLRTFIIAHQLSKGFCILVMPFIGVYFFFTPLHHFKLPVIAYLPSLDDLLYKSSLSVYLICNVVTELLF